MTSPRTLRGALIGCGFVSQFHLAGWRRVAGAEIVAVCDIDPARLEQAQHRVAGARAYRDPQQMFAAERFDFVEICTRPDSHRVLVGLAASHGAHVLCQKPAALVRSDLMAMIDDCEAAGVRLMIHENWRFRPWYRAMRVEIVKGTIGRPIFLCLSHFDTRALRPDGFSDQPFLATMPRLILMEMGCHLIDTARYLLGDVKWVAAVLKQFGQGHLGEDIAILVLRFIDGENAQLYLSWCTEPILARPEWALNDTEVKGTHGSLKVQIDGSLRWTRPDGSTEQRAVLMPPDDEVYVDGYAATQAHFLEGIRTGAAHETSGRETLKTMDVVWAAYRAAEEGRIVDLRKDDTPEPP